MIGRWNGISSSAAPMPSVAVIFCVHVGKIAASAS